MSNKQKHILILTPGFPKDEDDFNCIPPLQEFLQKFQSTYSSVKISVIAFQYPSLNKPYLWKSINVIPLGGMDSKIQKPLIWLNALRKAKEINKLVKVDGIHSLWLGECAMLGNILSKKFDCQHICTLMGQDVKASNKYLKWIKNTNTKFIALSKNQSELFQKLTKKNVTEIIHWGIDDQKIINQDRDIDLLGVGSLIPLKNYSLFIRIVEEIVKKNPDLKCKLVGSGPELLKLKTVTEVKRFSENIDFTGLLSRKEIFQLMQRSKILLHPSKFEGSGFVFAEALANGMNIISFNVGYAQEHPKWFIAKNEEDFISITRNLLTRNLNFDQVNLFPLQETVDRYARLYESETN
jgi:glycosyltransferase involved in cell wall biosynthesis